MSSLDATNKEELLKRCSAGAGDLILFAVGHPASVNKTLDRLRIFMANELGLIDNVWIWYFGLANIYIFYFSFSFSFSFILFFCYFSPGIQFYGWLISQCLSGMSQSRGLRYVQWQFPHVKWNMYLNVHQLYFQELASCTCTQYSYLHILS